MKWFEVEFKKLHNLQSSKPGITNMIPETV